MFQVYSIVITCLYNLSDPIALLVELQIGAATMKNTREDPQKIKNKTIL